MATILNIETSSRICSVALTVDGSVEYQLEDTEGMAHAERLAPFVEQALAEARLRDWRLDAVAVSMGPGSYTGLRIGLSLAKGLCFALGLPLIGVSTLKILAVKAMFRNMGWTGSELLCPMVDARRMEVYTGVYDFGLREVGVPGPLILDSESFGDLLGERDVYFMGSGADKARAVITSPRAHWIDGMEPHARDMLALAEKAFRENDFVDLAYSTPEYLKEWQPGAPSKH